jgi:sensor histidine kinase regulating citrate/malate metabolism
VRRLFWLALGLGAGAAGAVLTTRFAKKQMEKVAPSTIAREARGGLLELSKLVSESLAEGKRAMEQAESEARSSISEP